jgi:hypothetical protein
MMWLARLAFTAWLVSSFCRAPARAQQLPTIQFPASQLRTTDWAIEFESGRYKIHADFELAAPHDLVQELELLETDIEALLGYETPEETRVYLVLFRLEAEYSRYMQAYFPKLPKRRALFIQHRGPGMLFAYWHADVLTDLRHEVTHALLNHGSQPLPLWIDEGLAEYFEPPRDKRLTGNPYLSQVVAAQAESGIEDLRQLQSITDVNQFTEISYRDSWAWVHFLIHRRPETRDLISQYLRSQQLRGQNLRALSVEGNVIDICGRLEKMLGDPGQELYEHFSAIAARGTEGASRK